MLRLCLARLLIELAPFRIWNARLGLSAPPGDEIDAALARRLANHVERAALRLPFSTKCLPRAMTLSWMLRARGVGHVVVIAARPASQRGGADALHAWVDAGGRIVLGDLPGPWLRLAELNGTTSGARDSVPNP